MLCGLNSQPGSIVFRSGFMDRLGDENITATIADALLRDSLLDGQLFRLSDIGKSFTDASTKNATALFKASHVVLAVPA